MVLLSLITSHNELWNKLNITAVFTSILGESVITFTIDELAGLKRKIKFAERDCSLLASAVNSTGEYTNIIL